MLNHASLGVRDLKRAAAFYDRMFEPMNVGQASGVKDDEVAFGPFGTPAEVCPFWLYQAAPDANTVGARSHVAFGVETRAALDRIGAIALKEGVEVFRKAGPHPDISPGYYGLILNDPEGHRIEFVALGP
jgi:catechol 2,3-dioxygenase-like lactoylglutathione lyase family enzyme